MRIGSGVLAGAMVAVVLTLSACSAEDAGQVRDGIGDVRNGIGDVTDGIGQAKDQAGTCAKALGLSRINPTLDWQQLQDSAGRRAGELRDLADRAVNADAQQAINGLADAYLDLEQHKVDRLRDVQDWLNRNGERFDALRAACL